MKRKIKARSNHQGRINKPYRFTFELERMDKHLNAETVAMPNSLHSSDEIKAWLLLNDSRFATESKEEQAQYEEIPVEAGENDSEAIPNEVVNIMLDDDVSLLAAWRIYRRLSQRDVAERTGLTQSAISQAERKDSKPQKKTLERLANIYDCKETQLTL